MGGGRIKKITKSGPSSHRSDSETPFKRADDDPTVNAGLVVLYDFSGDPEQYCSETIYFVTFQGESGSPVPPPPSGSAHVRHVSKSHVLAHLNNTFNKCHNRLRFKTNHQKFEKALFEYHKRSSHYAVTHVRNKKIVAFKGRHLVW